MRTVLFVCTGNTCRSPMAEAVAREAIRRGEIAGADDVFVASAGMGATEGLPFSPETEEALRKLGIEHDGASKALNRRMVEAADFVLCMTQSHADAVRELIGDGNASKVKILLLDPDEDIPDPVGMGQSAYDRLARKLVRLIPRRLKELLAP
jgi:protein-tyrosine-phosphatase